jgi:hypothetical protein
MNTAATKRRAQAWWTRRAPNDDYNDDEKLLWQRVWSEDYDYAWAYPNDEEPSNLYWVQLAKRCIDLPEREHRFSLIWGAYQLGDDLTLAEAMGVAERHHALPPEATFNAVLLSELETESTEPKKNKRHGAQRAGGAR